MNTSTTNRTIDTNKPSVKAQLLLYDLLIPSIGGFIILLNVLVVISSGLILKKKQQPRATYLFLGNVALTDAVTGVAVIFGQVYPKQYRDHYICSIQLGLIVSSTIASIYSVGLIAIDRFLYIIYGIKYQKWVYPNRARLSILLCWLLGCTVGFMPLFGWHGDTNNGKYCWFTLWAPKHLILLTVIIGMIPLLVVLILYSVILYHALKKIVQLQSLNDDNGPKANSDLRMFRGRNQQQQSEVNDDVHQERKRRRGLVARIFTKPPTPTVQPPSKWKAIKVVIFTTASFFITWSPYFIASLIYVYKCENIDTKYCKSLRLLIASPLAILGFCNSLINPIIYAWWHKGFRNFVQKKVSNTRGRKERDENLKSKDTTTSSMSNMEQSQVVNSAFT